MAIESVDIATGEALPVRLDNLWFDQDARLFYVVQPPISFDECPLGWLCG